MQSNTNSNLVNTRYIQFGQYRHNFVSDAFLGAWLLFFSGKYPPTVSNFSQWVNKFDSNANQPSSKSTNHLQWEIELNFPRRHWLWWSVQCHCCHCCYVECCRCCFQLIHIHLLACCCCWCCRCCNYCCSVKGVANVVFSWQVSQLLEPLYQCAWCCCCRCVKGAPNVVFSCTSSACNITLLSLPCATNLWWNMDFDGIWSLTAIVSFHSLILWSNYYDMTIIMIRA